MQIEVNRVKIFVTVPRENSPQVIDAVCSNGAGIIGNYTHCTATAQVQGTFKPNDQANPYIGSSNKLEVVQEDKIEFVCNVDKVKQVIQALRKVHPYEEPAIDIVPLIDEECF